MTAKHPKPAEKPPRAPKEPASASPFHRLRGVALVELVIATARTKQLLGREPEPLPAQALATLTFDNGLPLPASLRRWLEFDSHRASRLLDRSRNVLNTHTLTELFGSKDPHEASLLQAFAAHVPHRLFPLDPPFDPPGDYLYLGKPDQHGEYPVLRILEEGGLPWVGLAFPGFDVYSAANLGLLDVPALAHSAEALLTAPDFRAAMHEQALLNFPELTLRYDDVLAELEAQAAPSKARKRPK